MRIISALFFAVVMWRFQFGMDQSIHSSIKKEALTKIDTGLGSFSAFMAKLIAKL
ncbi:MAG: hypothetical protein MK008_05305 [Bdellovibrionales bacterium]|nr:hypothetical protein [Bdellovibrionales bacterium]